MLKRKFDNPKNTAITFCLFLQKLTVGKVIVNV